MRVNDIRILAGFFAANGMSKKSDEIRAALSKIDFVGAEKVRRKLVDEIKMLPCKAENVMDFIAVKGSNEDILEGLERYRGMDAALDAGIDSLKAFIMNAPSAMIDLTLPCGGEDNITTAE